MQEQKLHYHQNVILNGDCFHLMREIPSNSVDLILADPPYGMLSKSNPDAKWDKKVDVRELWFHYRRVIKPNGAILLFAQGLFSARLIMSNPNWFRTDIIWDKVRKSNFLNCKKMPMRQHEQVLVFSKKPPTYNPQMVFVGKPNHSRGNVEIGNANKNYGKFGKTETIISDYRYPGTIVRFPKEHTKEGWLHGTSKPVNLLRWLIRTYSNEGDLVLDNFAGSGSTLIAAIREKRNFLGMEISEKYYEIAKKRIETELAQKVLF